MWRAHDGPCPRRPHRIYGWPCLPPGDKHNFYNPDKRTLILRNIPEFSGRRSPPSLKKSILLHGEREEQEEKPEAEDKGAAPSDFAITGITLNGEPYSGDCFEIDPETGKISISNTKNASTGRYSISISCMAGGKSYSFPDIVTVKMLAAAPEGIIMTPELLTADYGDVIDINSIADMPTSVVSTEGEHISITKYEIGAVELVTTNEAGEEQYQPLTEEYKKCFSVSNEGVFTVVQGSVSEILEPAVYSVSLIVGTKVGDSMLERAIQVKITSKP